jgi:diacylglycerol kinase (ATP)
VAIGLSEGCRYCADEFDIELDGDTLHLRALLIAFANGREYGVGARLWAGARLDDGLLDAVVVEDRSVLARFWHARHLASGMPQRAPRVFTRAIRHARVRAAVPIEYHVDGEVGVAGTEVEVGVRPGGLWVQG